MLRRARNENESAETIDLFSEFQSPNLLTIAEHDDDLLGAAPCHAALQGIEREAGHCIRTVIPQSRDRNVSDGIGVTALSTNRNLYHGLCDVSDVHQGNGGGNGHGERDSESTSYKTVQSTN